MNRKKYWSTFVICLLLGTMFVGLINVPTKFVGEASGMVLYVGGTGLGNYSKIQDAINNATPGDMVRVFAGIYNENVVVNRTIQLIGNGSEVTLYSKSLDCILNQRATSLGKGGSGNELEDAASVTSIIYYQLL